MCQICAKRAKNLKAKPRAKHGLIRILARNLLIGRSIPLLDIPSMYKIEAEVYRIRQAATNGKIYRRRLAGAR